MIVGKTTSVVQCFNYRATMLCKENFTPVEAITPADPIKSVSLMQSVYSTTSTLEVS